MNWNPKAIFEKFSDFVKKSMETYDEGKEEIEGQNNLRESDDPENQDRNNYWESEAAKIALFIRCGLFVLSVLFISGVAISYGQQKLSDDYITTSTTSKNQRISQKVLPIYNVDCPEKKVALSFDAAWGNDDTSQILAILNKQDIHVTFFMTGGWIQAYPDDVKAIAEAGHDLGNHSENHKQMSQLSREQCMEEVKKPHDKVKELTGKDMILFRPPFGDYNDTMLEAVKECGYYTIQWDVDSLDWKDYGTDSIIRTVSEHKNLGNGSIILLHNGSKYTVDALDKIISNLKEQGYEIVPISELIYCENYEIDTEGRQHQK